MVWRGLRSAHIEPRPLNAAEQFRIVTVPAKNKVGCATIHLKLNPAMRFADIPSGNTELRVAESLELLGLGDQVHLPAAVVQEGSLPVILADHKQLGEGHLAQQHHVQLFQVRMRMAGMGSALKKLWPNE